MKAIFSLILTLAFADVSLVGVWKLHSRECTSHTAVNDGMILQDHLILSFGPGQDFRYESQINKCDFWATGTYHLEGNHLVETFLNAQNCGDLESHPTHMNLESRLEFVDQKNLILAITGSDAAVFCPAGDTLISHYVTLSSSAE